MNPGMYWLTHKSAAFASVIDEDSEQAHHGWGRFLWLNYASGYFVTMLITWYAAVRSAAYSWVKMLLE